MHTSKVRCGSLFARLLLIPTMNIVLFAGIHRPKKTRNELYNHSVSETVNRDVQISLSLPLSLTGLNASDWLAVVKT